jgi:signal transduction histidine kinase
MKHKMVNLCDDSLQIAKKMKNFSKWVRDELLKIKQIQDDIVSNAKRYRCPACFKIYREHGEGKQYCLNRDCGYTKEMELFE